MSPRPSREIEVWHLASSGSSVPLWQHVPTLGPKHAQHAQVHRHTSNWELTCEAALGSSLCIQSQALPSSPRTGTERQTGSSFSGSLEHGWGLRCMGYDRAWLDTVVPGQATPQPTKACGAKCRVPNSYGCTYVNVGRA